MLGEVVGHQVVRNMASELPVGLVMVDPYGCLLERAHHALNLAIGPRMVRLGETMLDTISSAKPTEGMGRPVAARLAGGVGERMAVVREDRVDTVGHRLEERLKERNRGKGGGSGAASWRATGSAQRRAETGGCGEMIWKRS